MLLMVSVEVSTRKPWGMEVWMRKPWVGGSVDEEAMGGWKCG